MKLTERTHDPSFDTVYPDDLTHGVTRDVVGHVRPYDLGGKDIRAVLRFEVPRGPVDTKEELHVVTDDGDVYCWSRFNEGERWTFERRLSDGCPDTTRRQLPGAVEALVEQRGLMY